MSDIHLKHHFTLRDKLALQRTRLANERTLLTYVRTSLALLGFGLAMLQLQPRRGMVLGVVALGGAVLFMAIGFMRYWARRREIDASAPDVPAI